MYVQPAMKCTRNRKLSFLPIALTLLAGCGLVSRDEVVRVASPDGRVEAVLVETNGGATTSFGYEVHVVEKGRPAGDRVAWLYGAGRNAQAYGANLKWTGENELVIEYIKVSLRSGVNDPTAPAGGMLYNLELTRGGKAK